MVVRFLHLLLCAFQLIIYLIYGLSILSLEFKI
jgi:hypothetical protein